MRFENLSLSELAEKLAWLALSKDVPPVLTVVNHDDGLYTLITTNRS